MHHLDECAAIYALDIILQDRQVHGGVHLPKLSSGMLAFQHVHLNVLVVQMAYLAEQLEGTAIGVEKEAEDIYFVVLHALYSLLRPDVDRFFASHIFSFLFELL